MRFHIEAVPFSITTTVLEVICWSCGKKNSLRIRLGVPRCGACHVSLSLYSQSGVVVSPEYPVPSWWSTGLFRFVLERKRLPNFIKERAEIKAFEALVRIHNEVFEKRRQERRQEAQERERRINEARAKEQERFREETAAKQHWAEIHKSMRIAAVSEMAGQEFERLLRFAREQEANVRTLQAIRRRSS